MVVARVGVGVGDGWLWLLIGSSSTSRLRRPQGDGRAREEAGAGGGFEDSRRRRAQREAGRHEGVAVGLMAYKRGRRGNGIGRRVEERGVEVVPADVF